MSRSCVILLLPVLLWISLSDIRTMEIPDTGWFIIALLAVLTRPFWLYGAGVFLLLLPFSMKDLLGFGDVKLCTAMALLTGWRTVIVLETASLLALLFSPIFLTIPSFATAPALIVVGFLMMQQVTKIDWSDVLDAIPAFIAIMAMPFLYSISEGIALGIISYVVLNLLAGRTKKISPLMYVLAVVFVLKYIML